MTVMPMPIPILAPVDKRVEDGGEGSGGKLNALLEIVVLSGVGFVVLAALVLLVKGLD